MKKFKTVDEVLIEGQNQVNIPIILIIIFIWFLTLFLRSRIESDGFWAITMFIGLVIGFSTGWAYWRYKMMKWRIWAFENTKKTDWAELKNRAINDKLIWADNSIFEKAEFRSKSEQKIIQAINNEIPTIEIDDSLDDIEDDQNIPSEIKYYYAKSEVILSLILPFVLAAIGIFLMKGDRLIIGLLGLGYGFYMIDLNKIKNLWKKEVQLKLSDDGININLDKWNLIKWNDIKGIEIDTEHQILVFRAREGDKYFKIKFPLNSLNIKSCNDLLYQISVYSKRNQLKIYNAAVIPIKNEPNN